PTRRFPHGTGPFPENSPFLRFVGALFRRQTPCRPCKHPECCILYISHKLPIFPLAWGQPSLYNPPKLPILTEQPEWPRLGGQGLVFIRSLSKSFLHSECVRTEFVPLGLEESSMYSIVMMMALTVNADAAEFGRRGCCGCSCSGCSSYCGGCYS